MQKNAQLEIDGRILQFSKADVEGVFLEAKWINETVFPEIGSYVFIDSQSDVSSPTRVAWLARITGYRRTGILGDTASEMLLTYKNLDVSSLKSEIYEKVIILEVLASLQLSEISMAILDDLNILPTYGDLLVPFLIKEKFQLSPLQVIESMIGGARIINYQNQDCPDTNELTFSQLANVIDLKDKRTVIFGKTGTGKTVLSIDLLKSFALKEKRPVIIFDVQGEFSLGKNSKKSIFFGNSDEETDYLQGKVVIFSNRCQSRPEISSRVVGSTLLDLRELGLAKAVKVMAGLGDDDKNTQWYSALENETLNSGFDSQVIKDFPKFGYSTSKAKVPFDTQDVGENLEYLSSSSHGALARYAYEVVNKFHQTGNPLLLKLKYFLEKDSIIVFDLADCPSDHQEKLIEAVINEILEYNRDEYVLPVKKTLKPLIVIDEAQLFFSTELDDKNPVVRLFKEGRKFDLSVLMMTQQPSSMPTKVLSQVENIFSYTMTANADIASLVQINKAFNSAIQYQIDTNRKKYRPFLVTEKLPFAIHFNAEKNSSDDELPIKQYDKYAEFDTALENAKKSGPKSTLGPEEEHCWYKKSTVLVFKDKRPVFNTKIEFCRYLKVEMKSKKKL